MDLVQKQMREDAEAEGIELAPVFRETQLLAVQEHPLQVAQEHPLQVAQEHPPPEVLAQGLEEVIWSPLFTTAQFQETRNN